MNTSIALIGNPNVGKSTLMNALTGTQQHVGNWPGVTVEKKTGAFNYSSLNVSVTDLPGIYSLDTFDQNTALDEQIAHQFIHQSPPDLIVNIIDASLLERHLYLTTQLLEIGIPILVVLNKIDLLKKRGARIEIQTLEKKLGCSVIALSARKKKDISLLKNAISKKLHEKKASQPSPLNFPNLVESAIAQLQTQAHVSRSLSLQYLSNEPSQKISDPALKEKITHLQRTIKEKLDDPDIVIASHRYAFCQTTNQNVIENGSPQSEKTDLFLDKIFLNRWLGIPLFLLMMYTLFFFSINIGGAFQDFFQLTGKTFFVDGLAHLLNQLHSPDWLIAIIAGGAGKGINTTLSFVPILATMFFALSLLEGTGYMSRAAFVVDRLMRMIGLSGKSFIPLIVGFGCNVPSILATRTLSNEKDRVLTIMMAPFMSCNARLAIYSIFVATFFPIGGQNIIFALYLIGILIAIFTGWLLRKGLSKADSQENISELPSYQIPLLSILLKQTWSRLKSFIKRAGVVIVPVSTVIGLLNSFTLTGSLTLNDIHQSSLLSILGQYVTPVFAPIGIQQDNWPATVGLLTGVLAKEVVIGTLNTLYAQVDQLIHTAQFHVDILAHLKTALASIPDNLKGLRHAFSNPLVASLPEAHMSKDANALMQQRFGGQIAAFSYLLFILLYIPCISTFAAIAKELNRKWALLSAVWGTLLAYCLAVLFYQTATFNQHRAQSFTWVAIIVLLFGSIILFTHLKSKRRHYDFVTN